MDKTKKKLAAFFDNDEDDTSSFPPKTVDDQKLSQYASGTVRKSKREKEKEAADAKKKEEEENTAKAYAEFLEDFEKDETEKRRKTSAFVKAGTDVSALKGGPPSGPRASMRAFEDERRAPSPPAAPKPKGKRAMDSFLEEIKRDQADREARYSRNPHGKSVTSQAAYEGQSGSKDRGDPETTNVFVANLPANVTEQSLGNFFARAGPVGSVKVMWPRDGVSSGPGQDMTATRKTKNSSLSGFVSFMRRKDAETALREFDGFDWGGSVLRVGWSKAVPIAQRPMYVSSKRIESPERDKGRDRSRSRSRRRSYSRSRSREGRYRSSRQHRRHRSHSRSYSRSRSRSPRRRRYRDDSQSRSRSPSRRRSSSRNRNQEEEAVTDLFVRAVAAEVKGHGVVYEKKLKEREKGNSKFAFLVHRDHRRYTLYRGLVDGENPLEAEFDDDGYNSVYSTDSGEESERERSSRKVLGRLGKKRFEAMLRALSGKRGELARCMTFCLEHAEASSEVAEIIIASLLVDGTPVPRKVARLHLICDILHNSAAPVPSAWKYRQEFQGRLGIVFDHLSNIYHSFPGRITAETFKKQITAIVDIWEDSIVFPPDFTTELRVRLEGEAVEVTKSVKPSEGGENGELVKEGGEMGMAASKFKSSSFQPATAPVVAIAASNESDGEPMDQSSDEEGGNNDVDGEPMAEDVDGEPLNDVDGEPMDDDMDGIPVDDVDGEPVDDAVDGEPID